LRRTVENDERLVPKRLVRDYLAPSDIPSVKFPSLDVFFLIFRRPDFVLYVLGPPLWSGGQSSWLQIQRSGFDSRCYQIFWEVLGLERG
jgi:hypothetical protein